MTITVVEALAGHLRKAGSYNHDDKAAPVAVLVPDPDRLWESIVPGLTEKLPVLTLGPYDPAARSGPAIWIREQVDKAPEGDGPVVIYLPGVRREEVRAIESTPSEIAPIAEVQFRSSWWIQSNSAAWTPMAFLSGKDGLALDVARDTGTREALQASLPLLAREAVDDLAGRRLDASYFSALINPDETRMLLQWLSDPVGVEQSVEPGVWSTFRNQAQTRFGIDPASDGPIGAARRLGGREGDWKHAWARFVEAPHSFPGIPEQLRKARPETLFVVDHPDAWPQDNETAEGALRAELKALTGFGLPDATSTLHGLEDEHGSRRVWVWSALGQAPLAEALRHLVVLAVAAGDGFPSGDVSAWADWYAADGYKADEAAMRALSSVSTPDDKAAIEVVVRALYRPWLDDAARGFQDAVAGVALGDVGLDLDASSCVIFVDGLRMDVAQRLRLALAEGGVNARLDRRIAPFPTMTASGKPAVAPLAAALQGGSEFCAAGPDGKDIKAPGLRALLEAAGVSPFKAGEVGDPEGRGWTEAADLDKIGHDLGHKLVDRIDNEVDEIALRVRELHSAGWKAVHVVTDHGWLLMPGGLDKVELPQHLTESRKERCARLTSGAGVVDQPEFPWVFDVSVRMVSPRGSAAFEKGVVYTHGGMSPQEVVIPHLVGVQTAQAGTASVEQIKWLGLRCRVDVLGAPAGSVVDVRSRPGDPASSLVSRQEAGGDAEVRLLVEDDSRLGEDVYIVLLSGQGEILDQLSTKVGG